MKKQPTTVTIVFPEGATTTIDNDLVKLTKHLVTKGFVTGNGTYGALGGEYGYGEDYENDVFMMHHFCWCMKKDCPWCLDCYCETKEIDGEFQTVMQCGNCAHPAERQPNFWYKPTDLKIHWYKWIGRDMEFNNQPDIKTWKQIMKHCYASLESKKPAKTKTPC